MASAEFSSFGFIKYKADWNYWKRFEEKQMRVPGIEIEATIPLSHALPTGICLFSIENQINQL